MIKKLQQALSQIILGKEDVIHLAISCLVADGHLLLEDIPGMGKTTLSHALAHFTGMQYRRIQFTSDLLPTDLLGVSIFDNQRQTFCFHKGPIFSQLILADEINRATPKTQSALLEAMEERQVTTDDGTKHLPKPFFVIATQNPANHTGTYPLPESQLDRFMMRLSIGYPPPDAERQLLLENEGDRNVLAKPQIIKSEQLVELQQQTLKVTVAGTILDYVQGLLLASRDLGWFTHGLSPRAGRAVIRAAQAYAKVDEREFVRPEDIQAVLPAVVNHRLVIKLSEKHTTPADMLLAHVEVPI
jgi:MoxR-like ATPase